MKKVLNRSLVLKLLRVFGFYAIVFLAAVSSFGQTAENFEGFVSRDSRGLTFITSEPTKTYQLKAASRIVGKQLSKLSNLDAVRGSGKLVNGDTLMLETIDFVGLHRILGAWSSPKYLFNFKTFAEVTLIPTYPRALPVTNPFGSGELKYTITPADGDLWKVFFSNTSSVTLATLKLVSPQQIVITFFDEETGQEKNSILLTRMRTKVLSH